jgi:hypothetical protein
LSRSAIAGVMLELLSMSAACGPSSVVDRRGAARTVDAAVQRPTPVPVPGGAPDPAPPDSGARPDAATGVEARPAPPDAAPADRIVDCCRIDPDASSIADASTGPESPPPPDAPVSPDGPPPPPGDTIPLPLVVTDHFPQQGWFGDPGLAALFSSGSMIIRQGESSSGPCAARLPGARGRCIEVTYLPPEGLVPPAGGGWVGAYFLAPLRQDHPEQSPPARAGEGNWGIESGLRVAAGADRVSFNVASDQAGLTVDFPIGSAADGFTLAGRRVDLSAAWARVRTSLAGVSYDRVLLPLGWQLTDTGRAAHFYLDDIVWER